MTVLDMFIFAEAEAPCLVIGRHVVMAVPAALNTQPVHMMMAIWAETCSECVQ
jgi:hypothetical protein